MKLSRTYLKKYADSDIFKFKGRPHGLPSNLIPGDWIAYSGSSPELFTEDCIHPDFRLACLKSQNIFLTALPEPFHGAAEKHTLFRQAVFSPRASTQGGTITTRCLRDCHKPLLATLAATAAIKTYTTIQFKPSDQTRVMTTPYANDKETKKQQKPHYFKAAAMASAMRSPSSAAETIPPA